MMLSRQNMLLIQYRLSSYVSYKLHIIVQAGRELNICPCRNGGKVHLIAEEESADGKSLYKEQRYDCETCNGTSKPA
jgi:hypothetical protein